MLKQQQPKHTQVQQQLKCTQVQQQPKYTQVQTDKQQQHIHDDIEILTKYYHKWKQFIKSIQKQRYQALTILQFQNQLQSNTLKLYFNAWQQLIYQQKVNNLIKFKQQYMKEFNNQDQQNDKNENQQQQQEDNYQQNNFNNNEIKKDKQDNNEINKLQLAIKHHNTKIYIKVFGSIMQYGVISKRFYKKLSKFYIKFIINKYFNIINQFKTHSINKKIKKQSQTLHYQTQQQHINTSNQNQNQNQHRQTKNGDNSNYQFNINSNKMNYTQPIITNPYNSVDSSNKTNTINKIRSDINNRINTTIIQSKTPYDNYQLKYNTTILNQSRRSQLSPVSAYQSKRKFKPIMHLPSIPDIEKTIYQPQCEKINKLQQQQQINKQEQRIKNKQHRLYESRAYSQTVQYNINAQTNLLKDSKQIIYKQQFNYKQQKQKSQRQLQKQQKQKQKQIKQKILQIILKQKLITMALISSEQFINQGMEYHNYQQKTINTLTKIKSIQLNY